MFRHWMPADLPKHAPKHEDKGAPQPQHKRIIRCCSAKCDSHSDGINNPSNRHDPVDDCVDSEQPAPLVLDGHVSLPLVRAVGCATSPKFVESRLESGGEFL